MKVAPTLFVMAFLGAISPANAELRVGSFMDDWTPRDCWKPPPPFIPSGLGPENDAREYDSFVIQANAYISCMEREAKNTIKKASEIMNRKIDNDLEEIRSQSSIMKSNFDLKYRRY